MVDRITGLFSKWFRVPLKVGMITYNYPYDKAVSAGSSMHTYYLSRNLAKAGCEVHVFCAGTKDRTHKERIGNGRLIIHILGVNLGFEIKSNAISQRMYWYTFETRVLNQVMYENSKRWFDIIHTQGWPSTGFMLKHFSNMNWIHTFHSLSKKRLKKMTINEKKFIPVHDWVEKTVIDADRLVAVSNKFREEVIREIKGVARKTVTIPNGVDLELFKPTKRNFRTVLYIGRFSKEKGIELIPGIIEKVIKRDKRNKFIIVADSGEILPELEPIKKRIEELCKEYPKRIIWHSRPLTKEEISKLHGESEIYLQPSIYETFGMTVLEAMASGKVVVVTDVGGMPELVKNTGLIVRVDEKEISRKIIKLLENSKLRKKYKKLAAERAKEFEWGIIAKKTLDLYNEVIKENSKNKNEQKK